MSHQRNMWRYERAGDERGRSDKRACRPVDASRPGEAGIGVGNHSPVVELGDGEHEEPDGGGARRGGRELAPTLMAAAADVGVRRDYSRRSVHPAARAGGHFPIVGFA